MNQLFKNIEDAVAAFDKSAAASQRRIYSRISKLVNELQVDSRGQIKQSVQNIKKIAMLKADIKSAMVDRQYKKDFNKYKKAFDVVAEIQNKYYTALVKDYSASAVMNAIKQDAVQAVTDKLIGDGVKSIVADGISDILRTNINQGATIEDLMTAMRAHIVSDAKTAGVVQKYTQQITTDALNQYTATYNAAVVSDLDFEWFMYVGSNLTTTREFCKLLVEKKYYHISELPSILNGSIDGTKYATSPKTGLWYGAINGTDVNNFQINRGGWQCGHQVVGVPASAVPKSIRDSL